jgi:hypothetical protein
VGGVRKWESVVQISGVNNCGQVTSGVMDLIADETSETLLVDHKTVVEASGAICNGSMIPDTNVGGNIATINEVSDDQKATFFFS